LAKRETFYTTFYGFKSSPFHVTPDPDNIFLTEAHKHAIGAIYYGIVARKGFVVVTGEVGVGKTSVLRSSLERLDTATTKIVYLFNPRLTSAQLYQAILAELGGFVLDRGDVLTTLQQLLLEFYNRSLNVVLAIDEAQNMPEATLEDLRVLSNLETRSDKLLQIVLVGQPELDVILSKSSLRQLSQRIAARATIPTLSLKQSFRYIRHRVTVAGRAESNPLFSFAALCYIVFVARGNPRTLNIYCDNALMNGLGHHSEHITLPIAREALRQFRRSNPQPVRRLRWVAALAVLAVLGVLGGTALRSSIHAWPALLTEGPVRTASASVQSSEPVALPPTTGSATPARDSASGESNVPNTSGTATVASTATPPAATTEAGHGSIGSPTESGDTSSALDTATGLKPILTSPAAHTDADARSQQRGKAEVIVRPGEWLLQLCRDHYGRCDSATMQRVLEANPRIRSRNVIVSGDLLVFPPRRSVAGGPDHR